MASGGGKPKPARRQHYIARFYLRNFAEPLFSDNLCVYDLKKRRWENRSPDGVGWFPHLCSMIDSQGDRTDSFDQFLKTEVEDPAVPVFKKLATGGSLDAADKSAVAGFAALTAARSPEMINGATVSHLGGLHAIDRAELDFLVKLWCDWTENPYGPKSHSDFLKPSSFGAIWIWSQSLKHRLLQWEWHLVKTTRDQPFVTSDRPVFAQRDPANGVCLVSFPISSEIALIVISGGKFNDARDPTHEACAMNRQTTHRASDFVVACKAAFPGDESLAPRSERV